VFGKGEAVMAGPHSMVGVVLMLATGADDAMVLVTKLLAMRLDVCGEFRVLDPEADAIDSALVGS
jgi:hypothetical protein